MSFDAADERNVLESLKERAKELHCLYAVDELLGNRSREVTDLLQDLVTVIPAAWQHPEACSAQISLGGARYRTPGFATTRWRQSADLVIDGDVVGSLQVGYTPAVQPTEDNPFLPEEQKLLDTIAGMVSQALLDLRLHRTLQALRSGPHSGAGEALRTPGADEHWQWRCAMAESIARRLDMQAFGVEAVYLIGSSKNATAGPASDIDLLVHFTGNAEQRRCLDAWFDGWSRCLSEVNLSRTGYPTSGLLDIHVITDRDLHERTSFAVMIGATENPARLLRCSADATPLE